METERFIRTLNVQKFEQALTPVREGRKVAVLWDLLVRGRQFTNLLKEDSENENHH